MAGQAIAKVTGQHLLFLGTSTLSWTTAQFQEAAQFAKAHNIDNLLVKAVDGTNWWYDGIAGYRAIRDAIKAEGVGCIPYVYSYGNTYGYLNGEIGVLQALLEEPENVVVADMEQEWNGQGTWASTLCKALQGKGAFLVSTWADPNLQNWQGVIQALNPCISAYMPQQYDNYLASCWQQFVGAPLQPTVDMTQDFGANDPVSIASAAHTQGCTAISVWYYETAVANPALLDQVIAAFPKTGGKTMVPLNWTDDGTTLTAPNGVQVVLGFRDYVLANNWNANNWPLDHEFAANPVEQSNPGLGAGTAQDFRWTRLEYTAETGVFVAWVGQELVWYQGQYTSLQSQVAALQAQNASLQALLSSSNLGKINTIGQQISDDIKLIMQLVQPQ